MLHLTLRPLECAVYLPKQLDTKQRQQLICIEDTIHHRQSIKIINGFLNTFNKVNLNTKSIKEFEFTIVSPEQCLSDVLGETTCAKALKVLKIRKWNQVDIKISDAQIPSENLIIQELPNFTLCGVS